MTTLRRIACALLLALACAPALAGDADVQQADIQQLVRKASDAYQAKDYAASADAFAAAIAAGGDDATLYYNAACASALAGRKEAAFAQLRQAIGAGYTKADAIRADTDLASLHGDPRFDALLADAAQRELATKRMWNNPAWKTPWQPALDEDQRVAGLSRLWSEAKAEPVTSVSTTPTTTTRIPGRPSSPPANEM